MEFNEWCKAMKPLVPGGLGGPSYMRELISMFTTVSEDEWTTRKDPSVLPSDATLESMFSRASSFTMKFANALLSRLNLKNLMGLIKGLDLPAKKLIADNFATYNVDVEVKDLVKQASLELVRILQKKAKQTNRNKEYEILINQWAALTDYKEELLLQSRGCLKCGNSLQISSNAKTAPAYDIIQIDESKENPTIEDFAVLCPECAAQYNLSHTPEQQKNLYEKKSLLKQQEKLEQAAVPMHLDKEITALLVALKDLPSAKKQTDPKYNAYPLKTKIADEELMLQARDAMAIYKSFIDTQLKSLDSSGVLDFERMRNQVKGVWLELKRLQVEQRLAFKKITEWMSHETGSGEYTCAIVVCYFIQICEVFSPRKEAISDETAE